MAAWEGKRDRWDGHHFWRPEWETSRPSPDAARVHRLLRERPAQAELGRGTLESQTNPIVWATRQRLEKPKANRQEQLRLQRTYRRMRISLCHSCRFLLNSKASDSVTTIAGNLMLRPDLEYCAAVSRTTCASAAALSRAVDLAIVAKNQPGGRVCPIWAVSEAIYNTERPSSSSESGRFQPEDCAGKDIAIPRHTVHIAVQV
jgi:hypothetical protein